MIAKNVIGRSFKGVCNYVHSKVEKGHGEVLEVRNVRETKIEMIADFCVSRQFNPNLTKCVWHASLSFSKDDKLTDDKIVQISIEWMKAMSLYDTQWAIIKHVDTDHPHVHIIANRIADDGKTISDSNNFKRSEEICRELEKKYNLTQLPEVRQEPKINHEKLRGRDAFKSECHLAIQDILKRAKSVEEFSLLMKKEKLIDCHWKYNPDGSARGLTFQKGEMKLKGSDINRLYSALGISNYIEYKNKKQSIAEIKSTELIVKKSLRQVNELARANESKKYQNVEEDIIAIDKILNLNQRKLGYGR